MHKAILVLASAILLISALGACSDSRPKVTPPVALSPVVTPTVLAGGTPVPHEAMPGATATATVSATATISSTLPLTVTAEAVVVEVLNIRGGPGIDYSVVGVMPANMRVVVVGRSSDGLWLRIQCPVAIVAPQCWIIGGNQYVQVDSAVLLPTAPAPPVPPTPAPSATPTTVPCVVSPPAGWIPYPVAIGDTLSDLASRFGTSVEGLMATNCLSGDLIRAGDGLYVPASEVGAVAATATDGISDAGVVAGFSVGGGGPGIDSAGCKPFGVLSNTPKVTLLDSTIKSRDTFTISELVCIQPRGFGAGDVVVKVRQAHSVEFQLVNPPSTTTDRIWTYALRPGYPAGTYETMVTQDGIQITRTFTVTRATPPAKIRVLTPNVAPGASAEVIMAGLRPGKRVYLYRLDSALGQWRLLNSRVLPIPAVNPSGEATIWVPTLAEDNGRCFLVHTGLPEAGDITRFDPRVFAVGTDPKWCN